MGHSDRFKGEFDEVLAAARREDPRAYETIFNTLAPVVTGYLRLQGAREPEDLTSEVFVSVIRNLGRFEGDEPGFRSWVFTIAHRRLQDERRRLARRPQLEPLVPDLDPAGSEDVEKTVELTMSTEQVQTLCTQLAPDQRDVILMRLLGRLTIEEVATALDKSPGAVKALQRRGFAAIARLLEREGVPL